MSISLVTHTLYHLETNFFALQICSIYSFDSNKKITNESSKTNDNWICNDVLAIFFLIAPQVDLISNANFCVCSAAATSQDLLDKKAHAKRLSRN